MITLLDLQHQHTYCRERNDKLHRVALLDMKISKKPQKMIVVKQAKNLNMVLKGTLFV